MSAYIEGRFGKYAEASLVGAGRGLFALPVEHPLDVIKTRTQATPEIKSVLEMAKKIHQANGLRGFYTGATPNGIRLTVKQMYRYPMMLALPHFLKIPFQLIFKPNIPILFLLQQH